MAAGRTLRLSHRGAGVRSCGRCERLAPETLKPAQIVEVRGPADVFDVLRDASCVVVSVEKLVDQLLEPFGRRCGRCRVAIQEGP